MIELEWIVSLDNTVISAAVSTLNPGQHYIMMSVVFDAPLHTLLERFQWLKQHESTKYVCPDYAAPSSYITDDLVELARWERRLENAMIYRENTIRQLYECTSSNLRVPIPADVMSTAVFIFDRCLSSFMPQCVRNEMDPPYSWKAGLLGIASLFIAAKSLMSYEEIQPLVECFGSYSRGVFADDTETKILMAFQWNIVYTSPILIVKDLLSLLPSQWHPCNQQQYTCALRVLKDDILKVADYLTKLTSLRYGFNVNFPPSTIALAMLQIAFRECSSRHLPICKLIHPLQLLAAIFEQSDMSFSFADEDVKQCCHEMLHHMKGRSYENQNQKKKRDDTNISPATVTAEVHRSRRTIKKRNSFTAKTA